MTVAKHTCHVHVPSTQHTATVTPQTHLRAPPAADGTPRELSGPRTWPLGRALLVTVGTVRDWFSRSSPSSRLSEIGSVGVCLVSDRANVVSFSGRFEGQYRFKIAVSS